MPDYAFVNASNPKQTSLRFYHMSDVPSVGTTITDPETGVQWRRVFTNPQMGVDTVAIDPFSAKDYVRATGKKGRIGDLWDRSAEMSAKRAEKEGLDPVKEGFYRDYSKKRKGKKHPQQVREEGARRLKAKGISIDFGE